MGFAADFGRADVPGTITRGMAPLRETQAIKAAGQVNDLNAIKLQEAKDKQAYNKTYIDVMSNPTMAELDVSTQNELFKIVPRDQLKGERWQVNQTLDQALTRHPKLIDSLSKTQQLASDTNIKKKGDKLQSLIESGASEAEIQQARNIYNTALSTGRAMGEKLFVMSQAQTNAIALQDKTIAGANYRAEVADEGADYRAEVAADVKESEGVLDRLSREKIAGITAGGQTTDTWGQSKKGFDENGKPIVYVTNKKGEMKVLEGVKPGFGKTTRVYDREGNMIFESGTDTDTKQVGTIPPGYKANYDADGNITSMEPVSGGPAEREIEEAATTKKIGAEVKQKAAQTVYEDTERALKVIDKWGRVASGIGGVTDWIPEVPAQQLNQHIQSIKGNVGIDSLIRIKESGAGLGHIPQAQLEMLAALLGRLDTKTTPEDLRYNLKRIQELYAEIVESSGGDPKQVYADRLRRLNGTTTSGGSYTIKQTGE